MNCVVARRQGGVWGWCTLSKWLAHWIPDRAAPVQALAGIIAGKHSASLHPDDKKSTGQWNANEEP